MKQEKKVNVTTTNYPKDSHAAFCKRCKERYHNGICPDTGRKEVSNKCSL